LIGLTYPKRRRRRLKRAELPTGGSNPVFSEKCDARHTGGDFLEKLQRFPGDAVFENGEARGVPARSRQAINETSSDRIGHGREYDRHSTARLQQWSQSHAAGGQDDIWSERNQFLSKSTSAVGLGRCPAIVKLHIAALDPAQLAQASHKGFDAKLVL
jgi:hypothetical protein